MFISRGFSIIVGAALLLPAMSRALPITDYRSHEGDTLDLFVAGSSAQDNALQSLFRLMCEPNSLDVFRAGGGNVRLFFCRTRRAAGAIPGIAPGQKVALHKSSVSGSGSGVGPLIQRTTVEFLNVQDVQLHFAERCMAQQPIAHPQEGALTAYTEYQCANPSPSRQVPDAGISDVEPRFFLPAYNLSQDSLAQLTVHTANAVIFGVPVNLSLRNALQAARFPAHDACNPANPHYQDPVQTGSGTPVARGESEQCMPSLSRAQLAGIFSGRLKQWSQIVNPQGYALAVKNAHTGSISSPPGVRPPSDDHPFICRRVDTSGTQASYEMFFLNQRCTPGVTPFVGSGDNVYLGSVSSDVPNCLAHLDERNAWAVGILSTENVESLKTDRWRFIKMDGVAPTILNAYNGRWPFFVEQSYQWRGERSSQPLGGSKLGMMARIGEELGDSAVIRELNRGFRHAWGNAGVVALGDTGSGAPVRPAPGKPVDAEALDRNPILAVRHDSNNCSAVVAAYPTELP